MTSGRANRRQEAKMDEELTNMQKFSNWSFVCVASCLSILFFFTAVVHANSLHTNARQIAALDKAIQSDQVAELKVEDAKLDGKIDRLAVLIEQLTKSQEELTKAQRLDSARIYDLNSRIVWVYGTGGGAFGLMGFLQFLNVKKSRK